MIELKKDVKKFRLYIDGELQDSVKVTADIGRKGSTWFTIKERRHGFVDKIRHYDFADFPNVVSIGFPVSIDWLNVPVWTNIENSKKWADRDSLFFKFKVRDVVSRQLFSRYFEQISLKISELNGKTDFEIVITRLESEAFYVKFDNLGFTDPIGEELDRYLGLVRNIHFGALTVLSQKADNSEIRIDFRFPDEIKSSCEQYLIYFVTFLKDLGINAISSLNEDAGKVLFSVTPAGDIEALQKIREALALYLNLPSSPIVYGDNFPTMRLEQQVDDLRHAQKMAVREIQLAQKVIESQDKIIDEKNSVIGQQSAVIEKILSTSLMVDSIETKEELEDIFDGLKIGKSKFLMEQFGIHLNPATAVKTLGKKLLGKKEEAVSIVEIAKEED